jgi:signal transduction histidine kinase
MLGSAAHELRTPVGRIKGLVSALRRPDAVLDSDTRSEHARGGGASWIPDAARVRAMGS